MTALSTSTITEERVEVGDLSALFMQGSAEKLPFSDQAVDLVLFSPPYVDCRDYDGMPGVLRRPAEWVEWMLGIVKESLRVSAGPVIVVAAGKTEDRNYWPACEGLMWRWYEAGGSMYRPVYWHRYGVPGSGGDQWFKSNIEYCMCFKRPGPLPWSDNLAMGHQPKYGPGGALANRQPNGSRERQKYKPPKLANPGNLFSTGAAGGGNIGDQESHENEAPYPEALAAFFIRSLCPPGGVVLDSFSGSGTTVCEAIKWGRNGVGIDARESQVRLGARRLLRRIKEGRAT